MPNTKTGGNRWLPDIRPENIDTYTETNTPEGGTEQTAEYKIVDAHPIIGGVLDKLAFFRTHASAVWYNKMKNITVLQKLDSLAQEIKANMQVKNFAMSVTSNSYYTVEFQRAYIKSGICFLYVTVAVNTVSVNWERILDPIPAPYMSYIQEISGSNTSFLLNIYALTDGSFKVRGGEAGKKYIVSTVYPAKEL